MSPINTKAVGTSPLGVGPPMVKPVSGPPSLASAWIKTREGLFVSRATVYVAVMVLASLAAFAYQLRSQAIFACPANDYSADRYLAYCHGGNYGDYEHGAFYFNLEPSVENFVRNSDVLFLGNSRLQVAFSTPATIDWFGTSALRYYLLGFSYFENAVFAEQLLHMIQPRARVYVINIDNFFVRSESPPVRVILHDPQARSRYRVKQFWQRVHERICQGAAFICGHKFVVFRSRETGAYLTQGAAEAKVTPVSYSPQTDQKQIDAQTAAARKFLSQFAQGKCVILTMVPFVGTKIEDARAIARNLGLTLVISGASDELQTYDGYHLDQASAQRWSQAFFQAAGPKIRSCLQKQSAAHPSHKLILAH
jgi:hypothetical protein